MTFKVHLFFDNKKVIDWRMGNIPRCGDTMRFRGEKYGLVTEVIWCMDEDEREGQRVNIRVENALAQASAEQKEPPWLSAMLDAIDDCAGLTMGQARWLSAKLREVAAL